MMFLGLFACESHFFFNHVRRASDYPEEYERQKADKQQMMEHDGEGMSCVYYMTDTEMRYRKIYNFANAGCFGLFVVLQAFLMLNGCNSNRLIYRRTWEGDLCSTLEENIDARGSLDPVISTCVDVDSFDECRHANEEYVKHIFKTLPNAFPINEVLVDYPPKERRERANLSSGCYIAIDEGNSGASFAFVKGDPSSQGEAAAQGHQSPAMKKRVLVGDEPGSFRVCNCGIQRYKVAEAEIKKRNSIMQNSLTDQSIFFNIREKIFNKGLYQPDGTASPLVCSIGGSCSRSTGLQIRGLKFQSSNSNSRELKLTNLLGLVLGCIEAKFCK